jgi:hypothetical protein
MSYYAGDDPDVIQPWFLRKKTWIIAGVLCALIVVGLAISALVGMKKPPEIDGGATIVAEPDTRIYLGDTLVGTDTVFLNWDQLLGDESHPPIAVVRLDPTTAITPDLVSGPGAVALDTQALGGGATGINSMRFASSGSQFLIRRATGELDQVMAIVIDWTPANGQPRRFLLPLRLRKGSRETGVYLTNAGSGTTSSAGSGFMGLGRSSMVLNQSWRYAPGPPPYSFAEEIKKKGLWEPGEH